MKPNEVVRHSQFCKEFEKTIEKHSIDQNNTKKRRKRAFKMSDSEVITILILFHLKNYRCLKHFYITHIQKHMTSEFPQTVSYNRFVEFIDSTPLRACNIKREKQHKVFKGIAQKGQCSLGWFFGFKLHIVINDKGEIIDFLFTEGNVDDRYPLKNKAFHDKIFGKLFGDKGYISQSLFEQMFIDGIHLITKPRKNMKNSLMLLQDKILLRKRALIECVNDELKNQCQIEHTRHRNFDNFIANLISGLIAYNFLPKKPSINIEIIDNKYIKEAA